MSKTVSHLVENAGDRLDHYLAEQGVCTSRSEAGKLIKDGFVQVQGRVQQKSSYKVCTDDNIVIVFPPIKPTELKPHKVDFAILYEDKDILVLNKPANLVVHPGAGNYETSLVHGLLHHCHDLSGIGGVERPGIVHRLDKGTSGVMVVAKHDRAHQNLSDQFKDHEVDKEYWALCIGSISSPKQTLKTLVKRSETNRKKFIVNQKKGKEAISHISILKKNERVTLTQIKIDTGRTHQIRVHMNHLGHAILGDEVYGGTKKLKLFDEEEKQFVRDLGHPLLHAKKLSFTHPISGKKESFETDLPDDFIESLQKFGLQI
jgi:23S rRNA pseudouridine1911/1915/1917 synthase